MDPDDRPSQKIMKDWFSKERQSLVRVAQTNPDERLFQKIMKDWFSKERQSLARVSFTGTPKQKRLLR